MKHVSLALLTVMVAGCRGAILYDTTPADPNDGTQRPGPTPNPMPTLPEPEPVHPDCSGVGTALAVPLRRLTPAEFQSAIGETFGAAAPDVRALYPGGSTGVPYSTFGVGQAMEEEQVRLLADTADAVALALQPSLTMCNSGAFDACATATLGAWARIGMRRAATADELTRLTALVVRVRGAGFSPSEALAVGASALIQEPGFLYVIESQPGTSWSLAREEKMSRLALTLGKAVPDLTGRSSTTLTSLDTEAGVAAESARWLQRPAGKLAFRQFVFEWLGLGTLPSGHTPAVRAALVEELNRLIDDAYAAPDVLAALLGSSTAFVNPTLEAFYGLPLQSTGPTDYRRVTLPYRVGVLTHPLVMTAGAHAGESSVILRGRLLYLNVLCGRLAPPPGTAAAVEAALPASPTPRARYEARSRNATCQSCHQVLDPLGFTFEAFDGLGRHRTMAYSAPVDDVGQLNITTGDFASSQWTGARAFVDKLLSTEQASACFARQWARYATGIYDYDTRTPTVQPLACTAARLGTALNQGKTFSSMVDAWARDPSFSSRLPEGP